MRRLLLTLALIAFTGNIYAQPVSSDGKVLSIPSAKQTAEPPKADPEGPKAVLVGPEGPVAPGAYVRLKTNGSNGKDFKLSVYPIVKNFDLVTFQDGTTGVICQLTEPGTYVFCLALNSENKTDLVMLPIQVKNPEPPPVPDATLLKLQAAYEKDGKPAEKKAYLVALYRQMATEKVSTWKELADLLSKTSHSTFKDDELVATRATVTTVLVEKIGTKNGPVDSKEQMLTFTALADLLAKVN